MALEDIIKRIKNDTEKEILRINEQTEKEIEEIKKKYAEDISSFRENVYKDAEKRLSEERQKLFIELELKIKKGLLSRKWEIINNVFEKAYEKIVNLSDEERFKFITSLIKNAIELIGKSIPEENIEVYISESDYLIFKEKLQQAFKNIKIINNKDLSGGAIVRSGKIEINVSFDAIFRKIRDELESVVHNILFG